MFAINKKSAFTLIELAIVLVVVGLLAGGILLGKDLIREAEFRSVISDINKYRSAVGLFRDRYNGWPGDLPNASSIWTDCDTPATNCNGNGDGKISNTFYREEFRAWQQLSTENLIEGKFTGKNSGTAGQHVIGVNVPASKIDGLGYQFRYMGGDATWPARVGNYINIGSIADKRIVGGAFIPRDAKNIDIKIDDGSARGGMVRANYGVGATDTTRCTNGSWQTNPNEYNLSSTEAACVQYFWLE